MYLSSQGNGLQLGVLSSGKGFVFNPNVSGYILYSLKNLIDLSIIDYKGIKTNADSRINAGKSAI